MGLNLEEYRQRVNAPKRDKTMFLTDVFEQKVFIERGLVTARHDPDRLRTRKRIMLVGAAAAASLCVLGAGFAAKSQLAQNVGDTQAFWEALDRKYAEELGRPSFDIIQRIDGDGGAVSFIPNERRLSSRKFDVGPMQLFNVDSFERFGESDLHVPWLFKPFERLVGTRDEAGYVRVGGDRSTRLEAMYRVHVLRPLITAAARVLADPVVQQRWGALQDAALIELVHLTVPESSGEGSHAAKLEPLLKLLASEHQRSFSADEISRLEALHEHLFDSRPAAQAIDDTAGLIDASLAQAVDRFINVHKQRLSDSDPSIDGKLTLKGLLTARNADERLLSFAQLDRPVATTKDLRRMIEQWSDLWNSDAQAALDALPKTGRHRRAVSGNACANA